MATDSCRVCRERGLEIEHPLEEGRKHIEIEQYKAKQELERTRASLNVEIGKLNRAQADHDYLTQRYEKMLQEGNKRFEEYKTLLENQKEQIEAFRTQIEAYELQIDQQRKIYEVFGGDVEDLRADLPKLSNVDLDDIIR